MKKVIRISAPRNQKINPLLERILKITPNLIAPKNDSEFLKEIVDTDIYIGNFLSSGELKYCKNLSSLICPTSGKENFPLKELGEMGVDIFDNGKIVSDTVANYIIKSIDSIIVPNQERKNVGILGFGNIGKKLYFPLRERGYNVSVVKRDIDSEELSEEFSPIRVLPLEKRALLFQDSDLIINTLPISPKTNHCCYGFIKNIKKGVALVNISRRGIFDDAEVLRALRSGFLSTLITDYYPLGIDISEYAPFQAVVTPHIAWKYDGGIDKMAEGVLKSLNIIEVENKK